MKNMQDLADALWELSSNNRFSDQNCILFREAAKKLEEADRQLRHARDIIQQHRLHQMDQSEQIAKLKGEGAFVWNDETRRLELML